jgi:uncharacterized protein (UPF0548 family)
LAVFRLGRPSDAAVASILSRQAGAPLTYDEVGVTLSRPDDLADALPAGYHHVRRSVTLGEDPAIWSRARAALVDWRPQRAAGARVYPTDCQPSVGLDVAVVLPFGPVTAIAVCRVVAVVDEADRFGFAYGTLPHHPEQGEEAFVIRRGPSGSAASPVMFEVVAFSRPAHPLARLGGPVARLQQARVTSRYLTGMAALAV